mmetsp:Transcript_2583/g.4401  ORF Transcript_2583/g.4401 Transcript_2583/m.4401 type:complete len:326 (-) Transcript_2583:326-1303(-)
MFGVIAEVELLLDPVHTKGRNDGVIRQQLFFEIRALFPDFQRIALHHGISILAAYARLGQGQEHPLAHHQARELVHVVAHIVGKDQHFVDNTGHPGQGKIQRDGGVWADHPLDRGMRNIAFVPECHILHRRDHRHAHQTGQTCQVLGQHRVFLVGHRARPLLTHREKFGPFQHLGALHVANFHGHVLNGTGDHAEGGKEGRMAVAGNDLRADRFGDQPQLVANMVLDCRIDIGEGAHRAGNGACGNLGAGGAHPAQVAVHFGIEPGKGQAHGGRFGVNAVAAAHAQGVLVLNRAAFQGGEQPFDTGDQQIGGAGQLHVETGVQHI